MYKLIIFSLLPSGSSLHFDNFGVHLDDPEDLISSKIQAFVSQQAFGKKYLASKSVLIRRQSYHLVAALADRQGLATSGLLTRM